MDKADLLRIAFHNPDMMYCVLTETAYRSPVRKIVEQELLNIISKCPKYLEHNVNRRNWYGNPCPAMTVETFDAVLSRTKFLNDIGSAERYLTYHLFTWWKYSFGTFAEDQAPMVYRILDRLIRSRVDPNRIVVRMLDLLPETDTYDKARATLGEMFRERVHKGSKHKTPVRYLLSSFYGAKSVAKWDIRGKNFRAFNLDDATYQTIISEDSRRRSYDRSMLYVSLAFALRTEEAFLDYWKNATDSWRGMLASMHGKISKSLLEKLLQKYSRNDAILNSLLAHPEIPEETLMFYTLRGYESAKEALEQRNKIRLSPTPHWILD